MINEALWSRYLAYIAEHHIPDDGAADSIIYSIPLGTVRGFVVSLPR